MTIGLLVLPSSVKMKRGRNVLPSLLVFSSWVWLTHPQLRASSPVAFPKCTMRKHGDRSGHPATALRQPSNLGSFREVRACPLFQELLEFVHRQICIAQNASEELGMSRHTHLVGSGMTIDLQPAAK